ncbi:MAG: hypothetical protein WAS21_16560 [Geminicoccaceae bacterium]
MSESISRRDLMLGMGTAAIAGMVGVVAGSAPARAGVGWGPGPNSGLPFWFGAHNDIPSLLAMMPAGRSVDIVNLWDTEGHYLESATRDPGPWSRSKPHGYLASGRSSAVQWMSSPFCSGSAFVVPNFWPSSAASVTKDYHLNCSVPPTYTGDETTESKIAKQRRVWQIAADGWMDPVWRAKLLLSKQNYFVKHNLRNIRIVMRVAHELNTKTKWGNRSYRSSYGMMLLASVGDYQLVQEALRRYVAVFLDVFGNVQSTIPGDFAYSDNQLWPYWNTGPGHKGPVNVVLTCPSNAKLVGPDYYNFWPATLTDAEWTASLYTKTKSGGPLGIGSWLNWAKSIGRPLCLGEWALITKNTNADGTRPASDGWDNPVFIRNMLDFLKANAADIGFVSYFNTDNASSPDLPAHLIKDWVGIDEPSTSCVRFPVGDNNRCGARAFKQWMAANG